jgi:CDP-glycerol glycerophosphotransferase
MKKTLISIVIPTNHLDLDLNKLSSWIVNPETINFELILVVDEMYQDFSAELATIKTTEHLTKIQVIRGQYGNPGTARNAGIGVATSEWIAFWDSDDFPDPPAVIRMLTRAQEKEADVAIGSFRILGKSGVRTIATPKSNSELALLRHLTLNPGLWRICFKLEVIKGHHFPEIRMGEDQIFLAQIPFAESRIFLSSELIYTYTENNLSSLTHDKSALSTLDTTVERLRKLTISDETNSLGPRFLIKISTSMIIGLLRFADLNKWINVGVKLPRIIIAIITGLRLKKNENWEVFL